MNAHPSKSRNAASTERTTRVKGIASGVYSMGGARVLVTPEAIRGLAENVPTGKALPFIVNHDYRTMPLGKVSELTVEDTESGHAQLVGNVTSGHVEAPWPSQSGRDLVRVSFDDEMPFVRHYVDRDAQQFTVLVGPEHFSEPGNFAEFRDDLSSQGLDVAQEGRHSAVPDPLITFVLEHPYVVLLGKWMWDRIRNQVNQRVDDALRAAMDECSRRINVALKSFHRHRVSDSRDLTVRMLSGDDARSVTLIMPGDDVPGLLSATLESLEREVAEHRDVFKDADSITFQYTEDGGWAFCFVTTKDGQAIGSSDCWLRTVSVLEGIRKKD